MNDLNRTRIKTVSLYVMSFGYLMAGFNHFKNPEFYLKMMPPYLPAHEILNVTSGAIEMILAALLIRPEARSLAAWGIILLLIAVFPANVYMYSIGGAAFGVPDWVLVLRLPLQLVLMAWAYWHTKNPELDTLTVEVKTGIEASAENVWRELTQFQKYPEWNPFIRRAQGAIQVGSPMTVLIRDTDGVEFESQNTVMQVDVPNILAWRGSFIFRGLFDRTHFFKIERVSSESCEFIQGERVEGVLVGLLSGLLKANRRGFSEMNEALKVRLQK